MEALPVIRPVIAGGVSSYIALRLHDLQCERVEAFVSRRRAPKGRGSDAPNRQDVFVAGERIRMKERNLDPTEFGYGTIAFQSTVYASPFEPFFGLIAPSTCAAHVQIAFILQLNSFRHYGGTIGTLRAKSPRLARPPFMSVIGRRSRRQATSRLFFTRPSCIQVLHSSTSTSGELTISELRGAEQDLQGCR